jgi:hypothetical protein
MNDKADGKGVSFFTPQLPGRRETIVLVAIGLIVLAYFLWPHLPSVVE